MDRNVFGLISLLIIVAVWILFMLGLQWLGIPMDEPHPVMFLLFAIAAVYMVTVGSYKARKE